MAGSAEMDRVARDKPASVVLKCSEDQDVFVEMQTGWKSQYENAQC
jgi:hypothetical protein